MDRANYFGKTASYSVTDTPGSFTVGGATESRHVFIVSSDVVIHLDRERTADPSTSLRVPADTLVKISTVSGDVVSFVKGSGAADGTIWFSTTDS